MPTSARRLKPGDIAVHTKLGNFITKGDRVKILTVDRVHVRAYALKWDNEGVPKDCDSGIWLYMGDLSLKVCMFPKGGGAFEGQ